MIGAANPCAKQPSKPRRNMPYVYRVARWTHGATEVVYVRGYEIGNRALFQLETMPRPPESEAKVAHLERMIDQRLAALARDLNEAASSIHRVLEENGVVWPGKPAPRVVIQAPVSTRRAAVYLGLLEDFDALAEALEVLHRAGLVTKNAYRRAIYGWQRRLVRWALSTAATIQRDMHLPRNPQRRKPT